LQEILDFSKFMVYPHEKGMLRASTDINKEDIPRTGFFSR